MVLSDRDLHRRLLDFYRSGLSTEVGMSFDECLRQVKVGVLPPALAALIEAEPGESKIIIDPFPDDTHIGSCSVDLHLGVDIWQHLGGASVTQLYGPVRMEHMVDVRAQDVFNQIRTEHQTISEKQGIVLEPGTFIRATTLQKFFLPHDVMAEVVGRSTMARLGIVGVGSPKVDAGFFGSILLEIPNLGHHKIQLFQGICICQIIFHQLSSPAQVPYYRREQGGRYSGPQGGIG